MASMAKQARRAMKRVTTAWRTALIERSPAWARRRLGPTATYIDMLLVDHGVVRMLYLNRHALGPHAWRSAQPAPHQIRDLARLGVRTIVNLRGERACGSYWLEQEACRHYGITLVNYTVRSRAAPTPQEVLGARDLFKRIEYPILLHCKSGSDRAGLMSVLYRHFQDHVPIAEAKQELALRYGHIRHADTGVLDYFFERYLEANARTPVEFVDWLVSDYDPDELKRSFQANRWANLLTLGRE
jgi:protein tyrosine/serine phosphatase